jgi:hypothetical protein
VSTPVRLAGVSARRFEHTREPVGSSVEAGDLLDVDVGGPPRVRRQAAPETRLGQAGRAATLAMTVAGHPDAAAPGPAAAAGRSSARA